MRVIQRANRIGRKIIKAAQKKGFLSIGNMNFSFSDDDLLVVWPQGEYAISFGRSVIHMPEENLAFLFASVVARMEQSGKALNMISDTVKSKTGLTMDLWGIMQSKQLWYGIIFDIDRVAMSFCAAAGYRRLSLGGMMRDWDVFMGKREEILSQLILEEFIPVIKVSWPEALLKPSGGSVDF